MSIVALITWILTALGGFVLLARWLGRGGLRERGAGVSRIPPGLIFSHFLLAAAGLVLWIIYVAVDAEALTWVSFVILLAVALLGFTMFARWLQGRRAGVVPTGGAGGAAAGPPEQHFPVAVVALHGLLAAVTLILVLLVALGVGGE